MLHILAAFPALLLAQTPPPLAITHVSVIDTTARIGAGQSLDQAIRRDVTVVIAGDRITEAGAKVRIPKQAQVVDGSGKFLIPGLWDMHAHIHNVNELSLFVANGVTGVRVMAWLPEISKMREQIGAGKLLGPRMSVSSRLNDGPEPNQPSASLAPTEDEIAREWAAVGKGERPYGYLIRNAADARAAVAQAKQQGAEAIKIHEALSREAYFALAAESKKAGLPFVGHIPVPVSVLEASEAGQRSIEHMQAILIGCSTREADLRKMTEEMADQPPAQRIHSAAAIQQLTLDTFSEEKAAALAAKFRTNRTWQCPTLTSRGGVRERGLRSGTTLAYMPAGLRDRWAKGAAAALAPSAEEQEIASRYDRKLFDVVGMLHRAGVEFLAGTDTGGAFIVPGFSMHDEFEELTRAGFTPFEALQSATIDAARFLGQQTQWGSIEKGKLADLVLLNANPLEDIRNTRSIRAVVARGKLLDRQVLDQTLARVREANAK